MRRLEELREPETVRWHTLVGFVLSWAVRRRPGRERPQLWEAARASQAEAAHREEMRTLSETIEQTWEQELLAEGETRGRLREARENLRWLLERRFGALPEALAKRIEQSEDLARLQGCIRLALDIASPEDLDL
jgi:hypothetical protein